MLDSLSSDGVSHAGEQNTNKSERKSMETAKPAPEVAKLDYFVGDWIVEGMIFSGSWGSGDKFGWTDKTEWMAGKFFVVGHWDFTMPAERGGDGEELFVMGYD